PLRLPGHAERTVERIPATLSPRWSGHSEHEREHEPMPHHDAPPVVSSALRGGCERPLSKMRKNTHANSVGESPPASLGATPRISSVRGFWTCSRQTVLPWVRYECSGSLRLWPCGSSWSWPPAPR